MKRPTLKELRELERALDAVSNPPDSLLRRMIAELRRRRKATDVVG